MTKKYPDLYLGDGVYASCDGLHIWLATRPSETSLPQRIALTPDVLVALDLYADGIRTAGEVVRRQLEGGA